MDSYCNNQNQTNYSLPSEYNENENIIRNLTEALEKKLEDDKVNKKIEEKGINILNLLKEEKKEKEKKTKEKEANKEEEEEEENERKKKIINEKNPDYDKIKQMQNSKNVLFFWSKKLKKNHKLTLSQFAKKFIGRGKLNIILADKEHAFFKWSKKLMKTKKIPLQKFYVYLIKGLFSNKKKKTIRDIKKKFTVLNKIKELKKKIMSKAKVTIKNKTIYISIKSHSKINTLSSRNNLLRLSYVKIDSKIDDDKEIHINLLKCKPKDEPELKFQNVQKLKTSIMNLPIIKNDVPTQIFLPQNTEIKLKNDMIAFGAIEEKEEINIPSNIIKIPFSREPDDLLVNINIKQLKDFFIEKKKEYDDNNFKNLKEINYYKPLNDMLPFQNEEIITSVKEDDFNMNFYAIEQSDNILKGNERTHEVVDLFSVDDIEKKVLDWNETEQLINEVILFEENSRKLLNVFSNEDNYEEIKEEIEEKIKEIKENLNDGDVLKKKIQNIIESIVEIYKKIYKDNEIKLKHLKQQKQDIEEKEKEINEYKEKLDFIRGKEEQMDSSFSEKSINSKSEEREKEKGNNEIGQINLREENQEEKKEEDKEEKLRKLTSNVNLLRSKVKSYESKIEHFQEMLLNSDEKNSNISSSSLYILFFSCLILIVIFLIIFFSNNESQ